MKNKLSYITCLLLLGCLSIWSCKKSDKPIAEEPEEPKPTAGFSYTKVSPDDPFTFKFENSSKDFKEIRWEFGDDSTTNEISPTHTFINTGDYRVRMISRNGQGYWAQRETVIKLRPDSLLSFMSTGNTPGVLNLSVSPGLTTSKVEWFLGSTLNGQMFSTEPTAVINVPVGAFSLFSVRITTPKGSKAEVSSYVRNRDVLKDATLKGFFSVSRDNNSGPTSGEGSLKLIDNSVNSKFLQFDYTGDLWVQFDYEQTPKVISAFLLSSGDDAPERDPKNFNLSASDDGQNWTVLTSVTNFVMLPTPRKSTFAFSFDNTTPYRYYRMNFTANNGANLIQMSELRLLEIPQ